MAAPLGRLFFVLFPISFMSSIGSVSVFGCDTLLGVTYSRPQRLGVKIRRQLGLLGCDKDIASLKKDALGE